jgi:hypothetical protein
MILIKKVLIVLSLIFLNISANSIIEDDSKFISYGEFINTSGAHYIEDITINKNMEFDNQIEDYIKKQKEKILFFRAQY